MYDYSYWSADPRDPHYVNQDQVNMTRTVINYNIIRPRVPSYQIFLVQFGYKWVVLCTKMQFGFMDEFCVVRFPSGSRLQSFARCMSKHLGSYGPFTELASDAGSMQAHN